MKLNKLEVRCFFFGQTYPLFNCQITILSLLSHLFSLFNNHSFSFPNFFNTDTFVLLSQVSCKLSPYEFFSQVINRRQLHGKYFQPLSHFLSYKPQSQLQTLITITHQWLMTFHLKIITTCSLAWIRQNRMSNFIK